MYLRSAILKNTGPIQNFDVLFPFDGERPKPVLMVGKNGSGKSTVISFVVNALVAMKQQVFDDIEVEKGRVYRIRSPLSIHGNAEFFFAKLNFDNGISLAEWQLNRLKSDIQDQGLLQSLDPSWNQFQPHETSAFLPNFGELADIRRMEEMLNKNCLLFFPADRFEPPDWLNVSDLASDLKLPEPERMKGKTSRRIFSRNRLKPTLDWLNSVIFDMMVSEYQEHVFPLAMPASDGGPQAQGQPPLPEALSDRAQDNWEPLLAIAECAGPAWVPNGAWLGKRGPQATRVSGAWLFNDLNPYSIQSRRHTLYFNPWASKPLPEVLTHLPHAIERGGKVHWEKGFSLSQVLELPDGWPE